MRLIACLVLSAALAACGYDPCVAPTTGLSLTPKSPSDLSVGTTLLGCVGSVNGTALDCDSSLETTLDTAVCDDGFGIVIDQGDVRLLLHFANVDGWTAGGQLVDGPAVTGSMSITGLGADPQPPANAVVAALFDLLVDQAKIEGGFRALWP
jgi:hypothetical protein